jgi:hypothetical protein
MEEWQEGAECTRVNKKLPTEFSMGTTLEHVIVEYIP